MLGVTGVEGVTDLTSDCGHARCEHLRLAESRPGDFTVTPPEIYLDGPERIAQHGRTCGRQPWPSAAKRATGGLQQNPSAHLSAQMDNIGRSADMPIEKQDRDRQGQAPAERDMRALQAQGGPFVEAVEATRMPMVVTDPQVTGNPIIYANGAFLDLCGYGPDEVLGQNYLFLMPDAAEPDMAQRVGAAMNARETIAEEIQFRTKNGRTIWVKAFVSPMAEDGVVVRHFASFLDVTDRVERENELREMTATLDRRVEARTRELSEVNARLQEELERRLQTEAVLRDAMAQQQEDLRFREFMVREINHRTKNAFQLGLSLLAMQAQHARDPECSAALEIAMERIRRMAEVHALLTYDGTAPDSIDVSDYLRRLCRDMEKSFVPAPGRIAVAVEAEEDVAWSPDRVLPLGLIVGEALTNALKHAFPDGRQGQVRVQLRAQGGGRMRLSVEDDGVGLPQAKREGSLGLQLIQTLARQVDGSVTVGPRHGGEGTAVIVTFPEMSQV
ncbi:PAS domain S-box protein [Sabulicella glaciei]|uniref:histidine kinase n=1 Tax=Sabulicella glaciei TaxID=2984948 RepID=A0ABT3NRF4_9PROT|nr:PAS domain-containing protein [Roseococcus sp. MDT2-1-1]MCW8084722.1 PAS domain S-box protein [Roseococcus sp. MDT2-1-1]